MIQHSFPAAASLPLRRIGYVSRPARHLAPDHVRSMLVRARRYNAFNGINGVLTFDRRGFLQMLEGTREAVDDLMGRILRDQRHWAIDMIHNSENAAATFISFCDHVCAPGELADIHTARQCVGGAMLPAIERLIDNGYARLDRLPTV